MPPGVFHPTPAQISRHQIEQFAMTIQPLRHRLQLSAGLVTGETIEEVRLLGAFLAHSGAPPANAFLQNQ
jgi:hypothetical protein